nr:hypothetical protein [Dietzia natronolimnaea]
MDQLPDGLEEPCLAECSGRNVVEGDDHVHYRLRVELSEPLLSAVSHVRRRGSSVDNVMVPQTAVVGAPVPHVDQCPDAIREALFGQPVLGVKKVDDIDGTGTLDALGECSEGKGFDGRPHRESGILIRREVVAEVGDVVVLGPVEVQSNTGHD